MSVAVAAVPMFRSDRPSLARRGGRMVVSGYSTRSRRELCTSPSQVPRILLTGADAPCTTYQPDPDYMTRRGETCLHLMHTT